MPCRIESLEDIAANYSAIVLDQWGVLHDGSAPYPGVIETLETLARTGHRLAVLSNSGKRAASNLNRIVRMGFPAELFDVVMTSGEALWQDIRKRSTRQESFFPIERSTGDASTWSSGLDIELTSDFIAAEAILLMGLPDHAAISQWRPLLQHALETGKTVYCSNPDRVSPRSGGQTVISPGTLAHEFQEQGGNVVFYGKPYHPVYLSMQDRLKIGPGRLLMVGDSLEHDIAGAKGAGWDSLLVTGGIYSGIFANSDPDRELARLVSKKGLPMPDYTIGLLK